MQTENKVVVGSGENYQYVQEKRVYKDLNPTTPYSFLASSSARIAGLRNNANGAWYIETIVYIENGNLPPQIDLPVLFEVPQLEPDMSRKTTWTYQIRGFDPNGDNYRFRMADNEELGGNDSTIATNPPGLTISETGLLTWTNSGNLTAGKYSGAIVVNDLDENGNEKSKSQFDIILELKNASIAQYSTDMP